MVSEIDDLMTFTACAKRIGIRRQVLEEKCLAAGICIPWGSRTTRDERGNEITVPTYRVRLADAVRVLLSYRNPVASRGGTKPRRPSPARSASSGRPLHPDVRC